MLLKLLMPPYYRMIEGGTIVKWHKAEGHRVDYGEDLFDLRVEQVRVTKAIKAPTVGEWLNKLSGELHKHNAKLTAGQPLAGQDLAGEGVGAEDHSRTWEAIVFLRVIASETGVLRKVHAGEGEYREVGALLAELTTEEEESAPQGASSLSEAGVFRVVVNMT